MEEEKQESPTRVGSRANLNSLFTQSLYEKKPKELLTQYDKKR